MKALLIDSTNQIITEVQVNSWEDYSPLIGCQIFTIATYLENQDCIMVDDEGLLVNPENFFAVDGVPQPFAGNGLVIGTDDEGESAEPQIGIEELKNKITFLNRGQAWLMARVNGV